MHSDMDSFKKFSENKISTRDAQLMFSYYMWNNQNPGFV